MDDELLAMRDLIDERLLAPDGRAVARVAGLDAEWRANGELVLTAMAVGPEELASRVSRRLRRPAGALLRGKFEHRIPMTEIAEIGLDIKLRSDPTRYGVGTADGWVFDHLLRFIPGSGRR